MANKKQGLIEVSVFSNLLRKLLEKNKHRPGRVLLPPEGYPGAFCAPAPVRAPPPSPGIVAFDRDGQRRAAGQRVRRAVPARPADARDGVHRAGDAARRRGRRPERGDGPRRFKRVLPLPRRVHPAGEPREKRVRPAPRRKKNFNNLSKGRKKMKGRPQASTSCTPARRRACRTSTGGASPPPRSRRGRARIFTRGSASF